MKYSEDFLKWYAENEAALEEILQTRKSMSYMKDFLTEYPALKQMYWNKLWTSGDAQRLLPRKNGELIFCYVRFSPDSKEYCYLAEEDIYKAGDTVIVPVGENNHESTAEITSVLYCTEQEAPFPVRNLKYVIGKSQTGNV